MTLRRKSQKFEWHMLPSVMFVGLLIFLFVGNIFHAFDQSKLQQSVPALAVDGNDGDDFP